MENNKNKLPNDYYFELKFEDLIYDPKYFIKKLCSFNKINFEDKMLDIDLSYHNIGRYKNHFNSKEISNIELQLKDVLTNYNYI